MFAGDTVYTAPGYCESFKTNYIKINQYKQRTGSLSNFIKARIGDVCSLILLPNLKFVNNIFLESEQTMSRTSFFVLLVVLYAIPFH